MAESIIGQEAVVDIKWGGKKYRRDALSRIAGILDVPVASFYPDADRPDAAMTQAADLVSSICLRAAAACLWVFTPLVSRSPLPWKTTPMQPGHMGSISMRVCLNTQRLAISAHHRKG